jgi:hypothetical protein
MAWIATSESLKAFERCQASLSCPLMASDQPWGLLGTGRLTPRSVLKGRSALAMLTSASWETLVDCVAIGRVIGTRLPDGCPEAMPDLNQEDPIHLAPVTFGAS